MSSFATGKISVNGSDIQLGSVELKDADTDDRAKVKTASTIAESDKVLAVQAPVLGATGDTAATSTGTLSAKLRGLLEAFLARVPTDPAKESGKLTDLAADRALVKTDYVDGDLAPVVITISNGSSTQSAALTAGYWHVWANLDVCIAAGSNNPTATAASHPVGAYERVGIWINDADDKVAAIRQGSDTGTVWLSKAKANA